MAIRRLARQGRKMQWVRHPWARGGLKAVNRLPVTTASGYVEEAGRFDVASSSQGSRFRQAQRKQKEPESDGNENGLTGIEPHPRNLKVKHRTHRKTCEIRTTQGFSARLMMRIGLPNRPVITSPARKTGPGQVSDEE